MADQSWKRQLGKTIKRYRIEKGLTQEEAAERYGCTLRWLARLKRGRNVSVEILLRIGKTVGAKDSKLLE